LSSRRTLLKNPVASAGRVSSESGGFGEFCVFGVGFFGSVIYSYSLKMVVVVWKIWWWSQLFLPAGDASKNLVRAIVVAHWRISPA